MYIETKTDEPTSKFSIFFIAKSGKVFLMDDDISSYYDAVLKLRNIAYQIYHCDDLIYQIPKTNSLEDEIEESEDVTVKDDEDSESFDSIIEDAM
jgi:hypothetical protein